MLINILTSTKQTIGGLEKIQLRLETLGTQSQDSLVKSIAVQAIPLTLQTKLEKARMNSFELMSHLNTKSLETKKSKEHYEEIMQNVIAVNDRLSKMNMINHL